MDKHSAIFIGILVFLITIVVDPSAYSSFTAPKHQLLIVLAPLLLIAVIWKAKSLSITLIPVLILGRIAWLAFVNPEWIIHAGNDGFLLHMSVLMLLVAGTQTKLKDMVWYLFPTLFLIGITETAIGVWQLMGYVPDPTVPMKTSMVGTLGTPNGLGLLLVISFISGILLLKKASKRWIQLSIVGGLVLIVIGILITQSRGAWLALLTAGCCIGLITVCSVRSSLFSKIKRYKVPVVAVLLLVFTGIIYGLYLIDKESSQGRLMVWQITGQMIEDQPFIGLGQGNYAVEYLNYQADFMSDSAHAHLSHKAANLKQAHNEFLQTFAEGGLPGGFLFLLIWMLPLFYGIRKLLEKRRVNWNVAAVLAIHIAIITHSMVDSPLHVLPIALIGYINISLIPMLARELPFSTLSKYLLMSVLVVYFNFMAFRTYTRYPAYHAWRQGVDLTEQKEWQPAISLYQQALNRFGKKGELEHHLGAALIFNGRYSRGIYYLNQAKKDFNDRNIYLTESYAHIKLQKYNEAERLAKHALKMFPDHLAPHLLLGEIYYYQGDIKSSKASLKKCLLMDTHVISPEVEQIKNDAEQFWRSKYGRLPKN